MHQAARTALKLLLSALLGLFSLPMLLYGGYLFLCWFRIRTSDVYYADYPYAPAALVLLGTGILTLWATLHGVWRRSFYGLLLVIPVYLGLAGMISISELIPHGFSAVADSNYLSDVDAFFRVWYEENHRFPANEDEFRNALSKGPAARQYRVGPSPASRYKQRGNPLPYQIVVVNGANGPRSTGVSQRPGVIYYCVSKDLQEVWVTMTGLRSDVASTAYLRKAVLPQEEIQVARASGHDYPARKP
jgi:hypothetical protein